MALTPDWTPGTVGGVDADTRSVVRTGRRRPTSGHVRRYHAPVKSPRKRRKAAKAPRDFPVWQHPSGCWCKRVKGRFHYFGKVADDPEDKAALEQYGIL